MPARRSRIPLIAVGVIAFLAASLALARWLTTENRERAAILGLLDDQARGDAAAMLGRLRGCRGRCADVVRADARALRRPGDVKILNLRSPTAYALGPARGTTRVAWTIVDRQLPVVQCVAVERRGNALVGRSVVLHAVSRPIDGLSDC